MNKNEFYKNDLWQLLETEILPFVSKPGRYVGNEFNAIHKSHKDSQIKVALCFPDMYEIGMPYLGMQILYHIINKRDDCLAERAFYVWSDLEQKLKEKNIPLFSLESSTPLKDFDILGFHLTYEMNYATMLAMLNLSGLPLRSADRDESHPLVIAGGPSTANPEPIADFFDAIYIGDAEEAIVEIIDAYKKHRVVTRNKIVLLEALAAIPGVYVPQFYQPLYNDDGNFMELKKTNEKAPNKIKIRSLGELSPGNYPCNPLVPFVETSQDHFAIEIMRGCVRSCRFCQAGYQYRPRRQREVNDLIAQLITGIEKTGYEEVTLLSLSSTDYDNLEDLVKMITPHLINHRIGLNLPSLRPETINSALLDSLSVTQRSGLTLAPEAGSERLRASIGKNISDQQIFDAVEMALEKGWQTIKLYFMIGLPTENDEDIDGIINILRKISYLANQHKGKCGINVTLSPFNPKTLTPFQWENRLDYDQIDKRIKYIIKAVRKPNINIRYPDLHQSILEATFSRGDRRLADVLEHAYNDGARLDSWSEWFKADTWYNSFQACNIDYNKYLAELDINSPLPWDHIDKGISREYFLKERENAYSGIPPKTLFDKPRERKTIPDQSKNDSDTCTNGGFGRQKRRIIKSSPIQSGAFKLRVKYGRNAIVRFLSHLDIIRTLHRAIIRSGMPAAYSEGYHPHMKISFGTPLPLGNTSRAEYFDLQLTQPFREEFINHLKATLPHGFEIIGHKQYFSDSTSLTRQINYIRYEIPLPKECTITENQVSDLIQKNKITVKRIKEDREKEIEIVGLIADLRLENDALIADLNQKPEGHLKPDEILIFGFGIERQKVTPLPINRKAQFFKSGFRLIDPLDLV